jgi:hypothetical protein
LLLLLGAKRFVTTLLYSGSLHGWNSIDFHSRCDNKDSTVSLFKIKDGDCIGGFTETELTSDNKDFGDTSAMVFNLSLQRHFPNDRESKIAIGCYKVYGLCFTGGSAHELCAFNQPFNANNNCISKAN